MNRYTKGFLAVVGFGVALAYAGGDLKIYDVVLPIENCQSGCPDNSYYVDSKTNLMWEDTGFSDASDGAYKKDRSACKAGDLSHAKNYCATLNYAGYTDWRLPTSDELMEISKQSKVFKNNRGADFWTSTLVMLENIMWYLPLMVLDTIDQQVNQTISDVLDVLGKNK